MANKTIDWKAAQIKAHKTSKNAKTFTKVKLNKKGYRYIDFDTRKGYEYKGIVDLIAVKRDNKNPDNLEIILFQIKGGSAKIKPDEIRRLKKSVKNVKISWNTAKKPNQKVMFGNEI